MTSFGLVAAAGQALCPGTESPALCPGPKRCYERINDDRATYKEGVRAAYKCAEGPPGSRWNLAAADTPPSKRVGRRAYKRAREELAMLEREARPKQKPVKTLTYHTTRRFLLLQRLPERVIWRVALLTKRVLVRVRDHVPLHLEEALLFGGGGLQALQLQL